MWVPAFCNAPARGGGPVGRLSLSGASHFTRVSVVSWHATHRPVCRKIDRPAHPRHLGTVAVMKETNPPRRRWRHAPAALCGAASAAVVARLFAGDGGGLLTPVNATASWWLTAAGAAGACLLPAGTRWQRAAGGSALLLWAGLVLPGWVGAASHNSDLRVVTWNLDIQADGTAHLAALADLDADVLLLTEVSPHAEAWLATHLGEAYPHWHVGSRGRGEGAVHTAAVLSRYPLSRREDVLPDGGDRPVVGALVDHPTGAFFAAALHMTSWSRSQGSGPSQWREETARRQREADAAVRLAADYDRAVVAGDFNTTAHNDTARTLRRGGLVDAHAVAGWGPGWTWGPRRGRGPAVLRLDAVWASGLAPARVQVQPAEGSDHRALLVDFAGG